MTAKFSTTVTQTQRNACDINLRGRAISQASRQNTKRPGWNAPEGYVAPTGYVRPASKFQQAWVPSPIHTEEDLCAESVQRHVKKASLQVRPGTKRGARGTPKTPSRINSLISPVQFYAAGCEFLRSGGEEKKHLNVLMFLGVRSLSGDVCTTGCGWFNNGRCPAYLKLLAKEVS